MSYNRLYHKKWREKNKEHLEWYRKNYHRKHPEKKKMYQKKWITRNPHYYKNYWKEKLSNPKYRINNNMARAIRHRLKGKKAGRGWEKLAGYTLKDLISHLEVQFDENMSWENHGSYWHIDHIKPVSLFSFTCSEDKEFRECWALSNLQPLEAKANRTKGNKY